MQEKIAIFSILNQQLMKDFIYLVQGQADLVRKYFHLGTRENADAIFLTYDKPIENAIFLPNSSWAQGRNKMLQCALTQAHYMYYIFCDDDITFVKGGWNEFEAQLIKHKPAIGVPVVPKTAWIKLEFLKYQLFTVNDEQLMAFHHDVVIDSIVLPYQEQFDEIDWWASCRIQEILIQNFYFKSSIQFNTIEIRNECHGRYPRSESGRSIFREHVRNWLSKQFRSHYRDNFPSKSRLLLNVWQTLIYILYHCFLSYPLHYPVNERECRKILFDDSEIFNRYLGTKKEVSTSV